jgi:hypothetical protein
MPLASFAATGRQVGVLTSTHSKGLAKLPVPAQHSISFFIHKATNITLLCQYLIGSKL